VRASSVEIDGREFDEGKEVFESGRWQQNDLVLAGWRVLRFTATMVRDHPQIGLRLIERALAG
jgi:very-short-patch-repair endonuclease